MVNHQDDDDDDDDGDDGDGVDNQKEEETKKKNKKKRNVPAPSATATTLPPATTSTEHDSDVLAWVRRQSVQHQETTATATATANDIVQRPHQPPLLTSQHDNDAMASTAAGGGVGELFDSGTESGEDSTTQSNASQSDLNSFMTNLKMALPAATVDSQITPIHPSASAEASQVKPKDFLNQVDSVLDRLKSSLRVAPPSTGAGGAGVHGVGHSGSHQDVLHHYIASGGLQKDQPWNIGTAQEQKEIIALIDRLQSSLHHLQSTTTQGSTNVTIPSPIVQPPPPSPSPAPPQTKLSAVQLKAQSFLNPPPAATSTTATSSNRHLSIANQSGGGGGGSSNGRQLRATWSHNTRSCSSEPATPSLSPLPPVLRGRTPEFLCGKPTPPVIHRPIWCRLASSTSNDDTTTPMPSSTSNTTASSTGRIVLEKTKGLRGRFSPPELNAAPKLAPKTHNPVKLPHVTLVSPTTTPKAGSLTPPIAMAIKKDNPLPPPLPTPPSPPVDATASEPSTPPPPQSATTTTTTTTKSGSTTPSSVPWKVKLAKKKASGRSQTLTTSTSLEGSTSIDLRKSIQQAAQRKSMEDIQAAIQQELTSPSKTPPSSSSFKLLTSTTDVSTQSALYPLLKQKSLG